ncbi:MAG TPA: hypothetical protein VJ742_09395, partial [Nitrososphaera sp.]|nr:hypothetical protein [Nitrososphaera sp.]
SFLRHTIDKLVCHPLNLVIEFQAKLLVACQEFLLIKYIAWLENNSSNKGHTPVMRPPSQTHGCALDPLAIFLLKYAC